ncbi:MAG: prephenate dehydrogenase/arogenate dehydrogenase family protein [Actinomycetota bacterium]|nr:prephenate dehydrogenase/arogenate dehydrogenase family protein [Actinomycetota bacterium]
MTSTADRAVVVGLGLIGSSVALGLRKAGWHVTGTDAAPERAERARQLGVVDVLGRDPSARLAVVATPVAAVPEAARALLEADESGALVVTDVGSVKAGIVKAVDHPRFVGGHPMAGSEQEGPDGADPDLFVGSTWVLTPTAATAETSFSVVAGVARDLGADVVALAPDRHDELVAVVSHVPHLTAATLMALAADASEEQGALLRLAAGGFRDMTRIAAGDPTIWPDIFRDNASAVLGVLDALRDRLDEARRIVAEGDRQALVSLLERARHARRNLPARAPRPEEVVELRVPVPDRPGVLAEVTTLLGEQGVNVRDLEIAHSVEGDRGVLVLVVDATTAAVARATLAARGYRPAARSLE